MESASSPTLSDLPIGALSHVSSYLPSNLPSRALFAVALNYYRDIDSSSAIVGDQQAVLDFGDIEKELAVKLTDDDVRNILLSIDAVNNLKTLRLTNLLSITGIGLEPLRGSTMIEKIDLSLVGDHESPDLSPVPPISCTEVLPILDSIIDTGGACSLKLLIFPIEWRKERNDDSEFHAFLVRYNELLRSRVVTCLKRGCDLSKDVRMSETGNCPYYGSQDLTCHDCMKHYCFECFEVEDETGEQIDCMSALCGICYKRFCLHCCWFEQCFSCDEEFCVECNGIKECAYCGQNTCLKCISKRKCLSDCCAGEIWCIACVQNEDDALLTCANCDAGYCGVCRDSNANTNAISSIDYCVDCGRNLCGECRVIKSKEEMTNYCKECHRFVLKALVEDRDRQIEKKDRQIEKKERRIQKKDRQIEKKERQIQEMQAEINHLKRKVRDIYGESEDNE